jgi:hypothetical protein
MPDFNTITRACQTAQYAEALRLLDEHFGESPTTQYSTLKQHIEHYLNQGLMPPPATQQALTRLIDTLDAPPPTPPRRLDWRRWAAAVVATIAVLAGVAEFSGYSLRDFCKKSEEQAATESDTAAVAVAQVPADTGVVAPPPPDQKTPPAPGVKKVPVFSVEVKTDRSAAAQQTYREGETLRLFARAAYPCYLRALYQMADGQVALLADDRQVKDSEAGQWIEIGYGFEVAAPFGEEALHLFSQSHPFEALQTRNEDGYRLVTSGLPAALSATRRGLKPKAQQAETQLRILTQAH